MEADWEFEIGPGVPVIEARWDGYIDLSAHPEQATFLPETAHFPALTGALQQINAPESSVRTSKCDIWCVDLSETPLDPFELDASDIAAPGDAVHAAQACYLDLTASEPLRWSHQNDVLSFCKNLCARLREIPLRSSRVDLIIRCAVLSRKEKAFGVTAYLTACGVSDEAATNHLASVLATFAGSIHSMAR